MERVHAEKPAPQKTEEEAVEEVKQSEDAKSARDKLSDLDDLLDEIDTVLEDEAFAASFIQKGGE